MSCSRRCEKIRVSSTKQPKPCIAGRALRKKTKGAQCHRRVWAPDATRDVMGRRAVAMEVTGSPQVSLPPPLPSLNFRPHVQLVEYKRFHAPTRRPFPPFLLSHHHHHLLLLHYHSTPHPHVYDCTTPQPSCVSAPPHTPRVLQLTNLRSPAPKKRAAEDDGAGAARGAKAAKTDTKPKGGKKGPKVRRILPRFPPTRRS